MRTFAGMIAACVAIAGMGIGAFAAGPTIQIDANKEGVKVSPQLYGVFLEEIGHGVDGGLYGEMLQNRAFEDAKPPEGFSYRQPAAGGGGAGRGRGGGGSGFRGADANGGKWANPGGYATTFIWEADKSLPYWSLVQQGNAKGSMSLDMTNPLNDKTPRSCKLEVTDVPEGGRVGIANEGWCAVLGSASGSGKAAVGIKEGEKYELSFYARSAPGFEGTVQATLESANGYESNVAQVSGIGPEWKQFKAELTATKTDGNAWFILSTKAKGTLWFDMVSLFPAKTFKNRPNGLRQDIAQMIADLKPGFVRFPGGCVVESSTVETAYNWKNTLGPVEQRPEVWNVWDYRRTHGMGMFEYLQFIEDIGATPLYVGFAGQTCIYRAPAVVPMDQMGPVVDGYLDLLEYANGPVTSKWGKMRADSGHAAPFGMHLMEIGNENNDGGGRGAGGGGVYTPRYDMIYDALKKAHPEVETIADLQVRGHAVDMIDDHHYADPNYFINNARGFDTRSREAPPLYLGEVAVTSGQNVNRERGNLWAALAEGTYLLSCEKNADVVKMVSYAPLLGNVNGLTELAGAPPPWHAMIYFDSNRTFGTVSYYLWKTIGTNRASVNLQTNVVTPDARNTISGNVGVGTWGTQAEYKDVKVVDKDGKELYSSDFEKGTQGWENEGGRWSVVDGAYRQAGPQNAFSYIGDENWSDYTISLKARKTQAQGGEGFLVIFGHKGQDRYWWNIGGYGNTRHEIEMNQAVQGRAVNGVIESNKWYDLKVEVRGFHVRTWIDGELVNDVQVQAPAGSLSVIAGRDDGTGEIIVKAINRAAQAQTASVEISGVAGIERQGKATVVASGRLADNNSLDNPRAVVPVDKEIQVSGPKFDYEFPPYSLTVLRLKARK